MKEAAKKRKYKTPITFLKKSLHDSYHYFSSITGGDITKTINQPFIHEETNSYFFESKISIFNMALELLSDFSIVENKLESLTANGDVFRLKDDECIIIENKPIYGDTLPHEMKVPCYQVTRKHLSMLTYGGLKLSSPESFCHNTVRVIISQLEKLNVDISDLKIRVSGESLHSKAVVSSLIYSVELGSNVSEENKLEAWVTLNQDMLNGTAIRPLHVNFNNEILTDFSDSHFVIYKDNDYCWQKDSLHIESCSDMRYRDLLLEIKDIVPYHHRNLITMELAALTLMVRDNGWMPLGYISSERIFQDSDKVNLKDELKENREGNLLNKNIYATLMRTFLYESGFISHSSEYIGFVTTLHMKVDDYRHTSNFDLRGSLVSQSSYLSDRMEIESVSSQGKRYQKNKSEIIKKQGKSKRKYYAIYTVNTESPSLIGLVRCTNKTRYVAKYFEFLRNRRSLDNKMPLGYYITIPVMTIECNEAQQFAIDEMVDNNSKKTIHAFAVKGDRFLPITSRFDALFNANSDFPNVFNPEIFEFSGADICCVDPLEVGNSQGLSTSEFYTKNEIKTLKLRSFERGKDTHGMLISLAKRVSEGCIVSLMNGDDEWFSNLSLSLVDEDSCTLAGSFNHHLPFGITFNRESIIVSVAGRNDVTIETDYKQKFVKDVNLRNYLLDIIDNLRNNLVCDIERLPEEAEKVLVNHFYFLYRK